MFKKISKLLTLSIVLSSPVFAIAHAPGEEVCDGHAFTHYNGYLAAFNQDKLQNSFNAPELGDKNATIRISQFCNFSTPQCLENYAILQKLAKENRQTNIVLHYYTSSEAPQPIAEYLYEVSISAYIIGGQSFYQTFLDKVLMLNKMLDSITEIDKLAESVGISPAKLTKTLPLAKKQLTIDKKLSQTLKLTHAPSVLIMPTVNAKPENTYFSQYEEVPQYIIERALARI